MQFPQPLPSEAGTAGDFARQLALLLGPAYQPANNALVAADLLALGGALKIARDASLNSAAEAFADAATSLLSELEVIYGLQVRVDLSTASRRTRLLAKVRALRAGTPNNIVAAVRTLASEATLVECTAALANGTDRNPRSIFTFAVIVSAAHWADASLRSQIEGVVHQMKPAHAKFSVTTQAFFLCDDPNSLLDRDVLGA